MTWHIDYSRKKFSFADTTYLTKFNFFVGHVIKTNGKTLTLSCDDELELELVIDYVDIDWARTQLVLFYEDMEYKTESKYVCII